MAFSKSMVMVFAGCLLACQLSIADEPTRQEKSAVRKIKRDLDKAGRLFKSEKFDTSAETIKDVQIQIEQLAKDADDDLLKLIQPEYVRLKTAHEVLTSKGIELPKLVAVDKPSTESQGASFTSAIAPILNAKCGRCHVNRISGGFSMANYDALIRGPKEGVVIFPGKADDSRMIEVIVEGDMPRGGLKVSEEELAALKTWINEGAKFDGDDKSQNLAQFARENNPGEERKRLSVVKATGKESVSFSMDVAPAIVASCGGCHFNTRRVRGGLNLDNFQTFLRGGDGGPIVEPGNGEESTLVKRLRGTGGGQRMPAGRPAIADEVIDKISKWIDEGAKFDGDDARTNIRTLAARAKAAGSTHEELTAGRAKLARSNWKLVMTDVESQTAVANDFLVIGNADSSVLKEYGDLADSLVPKIKSALKAPKGDPLMKGHVTIFVFEKRYDYSEFGKMIEKRDLPKSWHGHWGFTTVDAYLALHVPKLLDVESLGPNMTRQIAATYIASLGEPPRWFADGVGYWVAAKVYQRDDRVKLWTDLAVKAANDQDKPDEFTTGQLADDQAALVGFQFVTQLSKNSSRFNKLFKLLREGESFDSAFEKNYKMSVVELVTGKPSSKSRKR